jgi:putative RecB family exonuclease
MASSAPEVGLRLPRTLSPSKLTLFKECALAFRYSAIDRVPEPASVATVRGTIVHRALERLMLDAPAERTPVRARQHLDAVLDGFADWPERLELALDDDGRDELRRATAELVDAYFELEDPSGVRPIGLEVMLSATTRTGVVLRGIIDRLELYDGDLVVTDYKTGRSPSLYDERARLLGVNVYAHLCEAVLGRRPARVQLLYLANREALIAVPTDQSSRGLETQLDAVWDAVSRASRSESFLPRVSGRCDWCGYRSFCPAHGGSGQPPPAAAPGQLRLFELGGDGA